MVVGKGHEHNVGKALHSGACLLIASLSKLNIHKLSKAGMVSQFYALSVVCCAGQL